MREGRCLGKAGGAFPPGVGCACLLAGACGGGDLAGSTFTEGGLSLATLLLMNVVGSFWRFLCCLQWKQRARLWRWGERWKLELHLVGARCWCRLGAARPLASALATLAFALALGRHQPDNDALLWSLGLELAQVW